MELNVAGKKIGDGNPMFITAEAGSNHNGKIDLAKKLIDATSEAGADAVKFQLFRADKLYVPTAGSADYLKNKRSVYDILKEMEIPYEWLGELKDYAGDRNLIFYAAAFDEDSADVLEKAGVPAYKITSYTVTHIPLVEHTAKKGKPILMSVGLASYGEIEEALEACRKNGCNEVALMHCVTKYPAPLEYSNLRVIRTLSQAFGLPTGLSDHTADAVLAPETTALLGGSLIEKHLTLDRKMQGPDHAYAIEPAELKQMVSAIRAAEKLSEKEREKRLKEKARQKVLGSPIKRVTPIEKELYAFARTRIFAIKDITKGERVTKENARVLRPGKNPPGLEPKYWNIVENRQAVRPIKKYAPITWDDLLQK